MIRSICPVRYAPTGGAIGITKLGFPVRLARSSINRKRLCIRRNAVENAAHDNRIALHLGPIANRIGPTRRIAPGDLQPLYIVGRNLVEGRIMASPAIAIILRPIRIGDGLSDDQPHR